MKNLNNIALDITEEEYRALPALNYSKISKYLSQGFSALSSLDEKVESPSLTFGSAVDCMLTEGNEMFYKKFCIASDVKKPSDNMVMLLTAISNLYDKDSLEDVADVSIVEQCENYKMYERYKNETKITYVRNENPYYTFMRSSKGKEILTSEMFQDVLNTVDAFKTTGYFDNDNPFDGVERYYQQKFVANLGGIDYKCMIDLLIIDTNKKIIYPIDVKTSGVPEYEFYHSFIKWHYDIQARLYYRILKDNLKGTIYEDYTIADYRFIVCNKKTLTPLVWEFDKTKESGVIVFNTDNGNTVKLEDPEKLGAEIVEYLSTSAKVPNTIELYKANNITQFINQNL